MIGEQFAITDAIEKRDSRNALAVALSAKLSNILARNHVVRELNNGCHRLVALFLFGDI